MPVFKGSAVAIVTPMKANGEVNYEKLGELIEMQIAGETDAIVICGTTGEIMQPSISIRLIWYKSKTVFRSTAYSSSVFVRTVESLSMK